MCDSSRFKQDKQIQVEHYINQKQNTYLEMIKLSWGSIEKIHLRT